MAFTRKFLASLGIESEKVESIMEAHVEVVNGLKEKIAENADGADELAKVKAELEQAKNDLKTASDKLEAAEKDDYKTKYETEKAAHEQLVSDIAAKETTAKKEAALREAAKAAKYSDDAISVILDSKKDYAGRIEFDKNGKAKNLDDIIKAIAEDKPALVPHETETRHEPANPPANIGAKAGMTWADIDNIKNTEERQQAMLANMDALGIK